MNAIIILIIIIIKKWSPECRAMKIQYGNENILKLSGGGLLIVFRCCSEITATVQVYNDYEKREYIGS